MATITQQPAPLSYSGVAGSPFGLLLNINAKDQSNDPIPWSEITDVTIVATSVAGVSLPANLPTISYPTIGQVLLEWTAEQTAAIGTTPFKWAIEATISGTGPLALIAGTIAMFPNTTSGASQSAEATLTVLVGTANVTIDVVLAAGSGVSITGNIDGGAADSIYLDDQHIDGGNANGD